MGRSPAEAADVSQTVWLSLVEHLDTILQPERVGAWLATTTRRECFRVQQRAQRFTLVDDETRFDIVDHGLGSLDGGMLSKERNEALWDAFAVLPEPSQKLLTLLMVDPPMSYQDISSTLDMPIGSIGPTAHASLRCCVVRCSAAGSRRSTPASSGPRAAAASAVCPRLVATRYLFISRVRDEIPVTSRYSRYHRGRLGALLRARQQRVGVVVLATSR